MAYRSQRSAQSKLHKVMLLNVIGMLAAGIVMMLSAPIRAAVFAVTYSGDFVTVDEVAGASSVVGATGFNNLNGLTCDPTSGRLYAVSQSGTVIEINRDTGAGTFVADLRLPSASIVRAIAASASGELYFARGSLHELSDDVLAKYDLASRTVSDIAVLRIEGETSVYTLTGLTFAADGRLIGWDQTFYGLIEIDPLTATATRLGPRGSPAANIETIAYAEDGSLHGIGGYATARRDVYFDFDARGEPSSHSSVGARDIRGMAFRSASDDDEPTPPRPLHARLPERPQPRPEIIHNLYLVDCGPCPQCMERPCDPRANPDVGNFLVWDPLRGLAQSFSRKDLGLKKVDGPIAAAAPLYAVDGSLMFVATLPFASAGGRNAGAIAFFSREGRLLKRLDGQIAGEHLGLSMDVWNDDVVVASHRRVLRLRGTDVQLNKTLAAELLAEREVRVAFTSDVDGDQRPDILLGAPQASVGSLIRAGRIEVIGSSRNQIVDIQYGRVAGEQLGRSLQPIRGYAKPTQ